MKKTGLPSSKGNVAVPPSHRQAISSTPFGWLVTTNDAWWWLGRREEARDLFVDALGYRNRYGLLAEDIHPQTGQLWGNFPQTYSMVGIINAAVRLSAPWDSCI